MRSPVVLFILRFALIFVAFTSLLLGVALIEGTVAFLPGIVLFGAAAFGAYKLYAIAMAEPAKPTKRPAARQVSAPQPTHYGSKAA